MTKRKMVSSPKQPTPPVAATPTPLFPPHRHCGLREHLGVPNLFPVLPWPPDDPPDAKRPNSTEGPDRHAHAVATRVRVVDEAKRFAHIKENPCRREGTLPVDQELATLNQGKGPSVAFQASVAAARPRALPPLSISALNLLHLNNEGTPTFTFKGHEPHPTPHQNEGPPPAACSTPATSGATSAATSPAVYSRYNLRSNPKPLEKPLYIYDKPWATIVRANRRFEAERSAKEQQSEPVAFRTLTVPPAVSKHKKEKKPKKAKKAPKDSRNQPMTSAEATPIVHTTNNNKINTYLDPATIVLADVTTSPTTVNYRVPQGPRTSILKPRPLKRKAPSPAEALSTSSGLLMTSAEKTSPLSTATRIRFVEPPVLPKKQKTMEKPMAEASTTSNSLPMTSFVEPKPTTQPQHFKYSNPHTILPVDLNAEFNENTKKNEDPPRSGMPEPEKTDPRPLNSELGEKEIQKIFESSLKLERLTELEKATQFHRAVENAYQFNELNFTDWDDLTFGTIRKEITEAAALHTKRFFPNWIRTIKDERGLWDLPESPQALRLQLILEDPLQTPPQRRSLPTRAIAMLAPSIHQSIMNPSMASSSRGGATMSQLKAFGAPLAFYGVPLEILGRQPEKKYYWSSPRKDTQNPFLTGQSSSNAVPLPVSLESTAPSAQQEQEEIITGTPQALEELLLHPEALLTTEYLDMFADSGITADDVFSPPPTPPIATVITPPTTLPIEAPSPSALASFYTNEELVILKEASVGDSSLFEDVDKTLDQYAEDYKNCSKTCEDFMKEILRDGDGRELTEFNNCFEEFNLASFLLEDQDMSDVIYTEQFSKVIDEAIQLKNDVGAAVNNLELTEKEEETLLNRYLGPDNKESAGEAMQI